MSKKTAAGIIILNTDRDRVLLVQRAGNKSYPFHWSIPGGKPEPSDIDMVHTAIREAYEEVGFSYRNLHNVIRLVSIADEHGYEFYYYLFSEKILEDFVPVLNDEHVGYGWFKLDDIIHNRVPNCLVDGENLRDCELV